jgi:SAM-dependent methyltransferase
VSRLDSLIRRLRAQHACLATAADLMRTLSGPILELGLGNGRTYDHLRGLFPGRRIMVFEQFAPQDPAIGPAGRDLIVGDIRNTLPAAAARLGAQVPLINSDIGSGDSVLNARLADFLAGQLPGLLAPGGVLVSDLSLPGLDDLALALPPDVAPGRYFLYQRSLVLGGQ